MHRMFTARHHATADREDALETSPPGLLQTGVNAALAMATIFHLLTTGRTLRDTGEREMPAPKGERYELEI